jgi:hypothetical protein
VARFDVEMVNEVLFMATEAAAVEERRRGKRESRVPIFGVVTKGWTEWLER